LFIVLPISDERAFAYLDPGTGSMMIQAILAGIAAFSLSIGIFWKRIKLLFNRIFMCNKGRKEKEDLNQNDS
jgi:hypothetical protein